MKESDYCSTASKYTPPAVALDFALSLSIHLSSCLSPLQWIGSGHTGATRRGRGNPLV